MLVDASIGGQQAPALAHFDRNGYGYVLERGTASYSRSEIRPDGQLGHEHRHDDWQAEVDPTKMTKTGVNVKKSVRRPRATRTSSRSSYDPITHLFYVGTNHICMDYQAFDVKYKAGFPSSGRS